MRIGFFYRDYLGAGGMPQETRYMAEAMARRGHEVVVYAYGANPASEHQAGVILRTYKTPRIPFLTDPELSRVLRSNEDSLEVLFLIGGHIPQNFGVSRASQRGRIPYVVSVGEAYNPYNLERGRIRKRVWKQFFETIILNEALAIRCYSRQNIEQLEAYLSGLETFILREGVHAFERTEAISLFERHHVNLLFLGRISIRKKGIDQLLAAVARLSYRHPELRLHLVGPVEKRDRSWFRRLKESMPQESFRHHGAVYGPEKYSSLAGADLFVHPSRHEGIPRSIREAMGVGTPLVVTPETNVAEDVERYEAGFVVSCQADSIAAGIEAFLEHPDKDRLRRNVLRMASELYDWDVIAADLEKKLEAWKLEGLLK
jgi:glycosyltransferase involved in cell wall biosynthesis